MVGSKAVVSFDTVVSAWITAAMGNAVVSTTVIGNGMGNDALFAGTRFMVAAATRFVMTASTAWFMVATARFMVTTITAMIMVAATVIAIRLAAHPHMLSHSFSWG